MKRFIGLSATLTPGLLKDYTPSLWFSAKHVPTLVDLHHVQLKTAKCRFYQRIMCALENTSNSLVRLVRLQSAEFVTSRQNFDTP
jgi:hypothetical protein